MRVRIIAVWMLAGAVAVFGASPARAQTTASSLNQPPATQPAAEPEQSKPQPSGEKNAQDQTPPAEGEFDPSQPDFTVVNMPTTLQLPKYKSAFRLTHRFARPLGAGDFGDLAGDLFGFDSGAQIGLEFRISLLSKSQVGIYRTSDKTIEFFGQYSVYQEGRNAPVSIDALASVEGTNNFQDSYSPALGAVIAKRLGTNGAVYVMPQWVNNTNPLPSEVIDDNSAFLLGLGARIRIRPTVYLVGEFQPRVAGDAPGIHYGSFGIEKRAGGHMFQLNISNSIGTTPGQIARGGYDASNWYIGFNLSRKFF